MKRKLSLEARGKIATAQKERWARWKAKKRGPLTTNTEALEAIKSTLEAFDESIARMAVASTLMRRFLVNQED